MARKDEQEIDNLFQLPLGEFTAARNALAKQAGKDGGAIRALPKPPVAAWAINQLYWRERGTYDALIDAATDLRKAHKAVLGGRSADLRGAGRAHDAALDAALKSTLSLLSTSGHPPTDATRQAIVSTLRALPSDEPAGRLTRTLQPGGFEALGGLLGREEAKPTSGKHEEAKTTKEKHEEAKVTKGTTGRHEEAKKAKVAKGKHEETKIATKGHEEAKTAKEKYEEAKKAKQEKAEREAAERQARERVRKEVAAATEALRHAEQEARREEFERARAARDAERAAAALQRARDAFERAQQELEEAERAAAAASERHEAAGRRATEADEQVASARADLDRARSEL